MKYLMLIYGNEELWNSCRPEELAELIDRVDAFNQRLRDSGELVAVDGLIPRARSVRLQDGVAAVTDGPYLEAKEYVGSYFIVDVVDEERAVEIAQSYPALGFGTRMGGGLEMWPLMSGGSDIG